MLILHYKQSMILVKVPDEYNQYWNFYVEGQDSIPFTFKQN